MEQQSLEEQAMEYGVDLQLIDPEIAIEIRKILMTPFKSSSDEMNIATYQWLSDRTQQEKGKSIPVTLTTWFPIKKHILNNFYKSLIEQISRQIYGKAHKRFGKKVKEIAFIEGYDEALKSPDPRDKRRVFPNEKKTRTLIKATDKDVPYIAPHIHTTIFIPEGLNKAEKDIKEMIKQKWQEIVEKGTPQKINKANNTGNTFFSDPKERSIDGYVGYSTKKRTKTRKSKPYAIIDHLIL